MHVPQIQTQNLWFWAMQAYDNLLSPSDLFYAAPEMLWPSTKERSVKELQKSDAYSFAIVMYELFAREPPYDTADIAPESE